MNNYSVLINVISALLGSLYIVFYFKSICDFRLTLKRSLAFIAAFALLNGIISSLTNTVAAKPILLIVLSMGLIKGILKAPIVQAFLSFALYAIGLAIGNALFPVLIPNQTVATTFANPLLLLAGNLFCNLMVFIIFLLVKPTKKYIKKIGHSDKFLLLLTAATIVVLCTTFAMHLYSSNFGKHFYLITALISISYCIFIILMWFNALRRVIRDEDLKQQKFYNESLRSTLFELRRFRHDWINNLTVIASMIKMNKTDELRQYVGELIDQCSNRINTQIYDIKNAGLFGILSSKINLAAEKGITVSMNIMGEVEDIPGIKISELCEVIGIFMDNAIEETASGDKSISVNIKNGDSFIEISISNSCTTVPDMQKIYLDGYSSKGPDRGMGLAIAKKILSNYKNVLHITTYEDNIFTQTIEIANKKG